MSAKKKTSNNMYAEFSLSWPSDECIMVQQVADETVPTATEASTSALSNPASQHSGAAVNPFRAPVCC